MCARTHNSRVSLEVLSAVKNNSIFYRLGFVSTLRIFTKGQYRKYSTLCCGWNNIFKLVWYHCNPELLSGTLEYAFDTFNLWQTCQTLLCYWYILCLEIKYTHLVWKVRSSRWIYIWKNFSIWRWLEFFLTGLSADSWKVTFFIESLLDFPYLFIFKEYK